MTDNYIIVVENPELTDDADVFTAITDAFAETDDVSAHSEAATEAQEQADAAVAVGDYETAAELREVAEDEAWAAGDASMLHGSDASQLEHAAYHQEQAEYYEQQQAQHAQEGDYEAAREDSANAAWHMQSADYSASGDDHSGQALAEHYEMDLAVWEEGIADYNAQTAADYAAEGDFDNAAMYAGHAVEHQAAADWHGDLGEHGGEFGVYDESSVTYDHTPDTSYAATDYSSSDSSSDY